MLTEYIAQMTRREMRNILLRDEVVAELRRVIEQNPYIPRTSQLLNALRYRETAEMGVSKAEIAKVFYPERFDRSYGAGCYLARLLIGRMKRNPKGRWAVINAAKVPIEGYGKKWVYYNMQSEDDPNYKWVERHIKAIQDGHEENIERRRDLVQMDPDERRRRQEEFEEKRKARRKGVQQ